MVKTSGYLGFQLLVITLFRFLLSFAVANSELGSSLLFRLPVHMHCDVAAIVVCRRICTYLP